MIVNIGVFLLLLILPLFIWMLKCSIKSKDEDAFALGCSISIIGIMVTIGLSLRFFVTGVEVDMSNLIRIKPEKAAYKRQIKTDYDHLVKDIAKGGER